jgi:hypothetical protein
MNLDDKDKKLIILAMDAGAADGEIVNAAVALFHRFRSRFRDGYELVKNIESMPAPKNDISERMIQREVCSGVVLRFGKYKGRTLRDVPVDYLFWVLTNCQSLNPHTRQAINGFLGRK